MRKRERLIYCLKNLGITAKILHQETGIELSTCYRIVSGQNMPNYHNLGKICDAYPMIPLRYIFTGS